MANGLRIIDGSTSFESGVDSGKNTTIASSANPNGLKRSSLAWLNNGTVRGGGISNRTGYQPLVQGVPWSGLYQGGYLHEPDAANPHLILSIGGRIYQVRVDTDNSVRDLSAEFGLVNPPDVAQGFFEQGELWTIIQAGDFVTPPLFWDGTLLRRSNGITGITVPGDPNVNELPPAGPMHYYMQRLWYAFGRTYCAGDIVKGPSGTPGPPYFKRDSILKVTESPVGAVGDGFVVPSNAGNIRGITSTAELDTATGEGRLYIGTRKTIYRLAVPVKRSEWIATDNDNGQPFQTVAQIKSGFVNDRSLVRVNSDLFYQTLLPSVASLALSIRNFGQWGNKSISKNETRAMRFNDRSLLYAASGIEFNNRVYQTALPFASPVGVAHKGILPLDLDIISSLQDDLPPAWEGMLEGLDVLQMFEGDFGGLQRAFAIVVSRVSGDIEVWEITQASRTDNGDNRIARLIETPSYDWSIAGSSVFRLKQLETLELWYDKLFGTVEFEVYFRPDQHPCWIKWHAWKECAARDCFEDVEGPFCDYPATPYCEQYRATKTLPKPPDTCLATQQRGVNIGYQYQIKIVTKGTNRIRGLLLHALPVDKRPFEGMTCDVRRYYNTAYLTIPAGTYSSTFNQLDADSIAIAAYNAAILTIAPVPPESVVSGDVQDDADAQDSSDASVINLGIGDESANAQDVSDATATFNVSQSENVTSQDTSDAVVVIIIPQDDMESYANSADLNGLNGGLYWDGAYVSRGSNLGLRSDDDMESYADSAALNGLNGGSGWNGVYVAR